MDRRNNLNASRGGVFHVHVRVGLDMEDEHRAHTEAHSETVLRSHSSYGSVQQSSRNRAAAVEAPHSLKFHSLPTFLPPTSMSRFTGQCSAEPTPPSSPVARGSYTPRTPNLTLLHLYHAMYHPSTTAVENHGTS